MERRAAITAAAAITASMLAAGGAIAVTGGLVGSASTEPAVPATAVDQPAPEEVVTVVVDRPAASQPAAAGAVTPLPAGEPAHGGFSEDDESFDDESSFDDQSSFDEESSDDESSFDDVSSDDESSVERA